MGWVVAMVLGVAGCGASRRVLPEEDAGPATDADSDVDSDSDSDADTGTAACTTDADADRHLAPECGGDDCDDADPSVHPGASDPAWSLELISESGRSPGIAFAPDGTLFVVLAEGDEIRAYRKDAGVWSSELVAVDDQTEVLSCGIDEAGTRHVAWISERQAWYASDRSGDFRDNHFDDDCSGEPSLALTGDSTAVVAYQCGASGLRLASFDGDGPAIETVAHAPAYTNSGGLAFGMDGVGHVAMPWAGLRHLTNETGLWLETSVDPEASGGRGIAVGADGRVRIAYEAIRDETGEHRFAIRDPDAWRIEVLPTLAGVQDFVLDADDGVHGIGVTFDEFTAELVYLHRDADAWSEETIVRHETGSGGDPRIALDADGMAHVVYEVVSGVDEGAWHAWRGAGDSIDQDCDGIDG